MRHVAGARNAAQDCMRLQHLQETIMSSTAQLNVQQLIDSGRFSCYQFLIAFLCFAIIAIDGFDTAIIGFIAPSLRGEW
jgi:hypothetical protein